MSLTQFYDLQSKNNTKTLYHKHSHNKTEYVLCNAKQETEINNSCPQGGVQTMISDAFTIENSHIILEKSLSKKAQ